MAVLSVGAGSRGRDFWLRLLSVSHRMRHGKECVEKDGLDLTSRKSTGLDSRWHRRYTAFMSESPHILVQMLHSAAKVPRYAHSGPWGDLAADLYAVAERTLEPGETAAIPTGLALAFPSEYGALIEDRSGLALRGLTTLAGVIDPGYRGEIKVVLTNLASAAHAIAPGDRIAQLRLVRRIEATFEAVETLDETVRGAGGFGSTGL